MKWIGILILLMLLRTFSGFSQSCCDSLKMAKSYGRVLVKDNVLKDSLLSIRKQTIQVLSLEVQRLSLTNLKLTESNTSLKSKVKTIRTRKNVAIAVSFSLFLILVAK